MLNACKQILKRLKWFYYRGIISYHLVVYILEVWVVYLYLRRGELSFISIFLWFVYFFGGVYCWYISFLLVILQFFSITAVLMNLIRIKFRFYYPICIWKGKSKLCWDKFTFMPQNFAHLYACLFLYSCYKYIFFK